MSTIATAWFLLTLTTAHARLEAQPSQRDCELLRADSIDAVCDRHDDAKRQRCYGHVARKYACRPVRGSTVAPCFEDGSGVCVTARVQ